MKRITQEEIQRGLVHSRSIIQRRFRKGKHNKRRAANIRVLSRLSIPAPEYLDLFNEDNYKDFTDLLNDITIAIDNGEKILIDFKATVSLKACAVVVLYSHIDYFQKKTNDTNIIKVTLSNNKRINSWLRDSGIWALTKFNFGNSNPESTLSIISAVAGSNSTEKINTESRDKIRKILKFIREKIYGGKISGEEAQRLYAAITESISNVGLHAYSDENQFNEFIELIGKRWWILARQINDQLFLVIYDMGEGIPSTLVKRSFFGVLKRIIFEPKTDAEKILAAVQYGATRMKSDKHGKGLHDIKTYVVDNPMGELHIFSGMGKYSFTSSTGEELKNDLEYGVVGTLIQWNISLKAKT